MLLYLFNINLREYQKNYWTPGKVTLILPRVFNIEFQTRVLKKNFKKNSSYFLIFLIFMFLDFYYFLFFYIASLQWLPIPEWIINVLNQLLYKFLWKVHDKVTRVSAIDYYERGGIKMVDLNGWLRPLGCLRPTFS